MSSESSPPPAGVPGTGGNTKYIAVVLLLLVAIVAVVLLKFCGKPETLPVPAPATTTIIQQESRLDDVPPPPAIEDAGPDVGPRFRYVTIADPCNVKKCTGESTEELNNALTARSRQAKRCYEKMLETDPTLKGKVDVTVRVAPNGVICSSRIDSTDIPQVSTCVERALARGVPLSPPKGNSCVDAKVPVVFKPGAR